MEHARLVCPQNSSEQDVFSMFHAPFPTWPAFTDEEADAVSAILRSNKVNYWTGNEGRTFEAEFANFAGALHAIAVANGTLALDLIWHGLGIGDRNGGHETDEVIVTPRSFIASASSIVNAGARPVFADVDCDTGNLNPEAVAALRTPRTRAILAVHLAGWPCDMDALREVSRGRDVALIEDCAQAHGALYKGRPVGALGDAAAWSFCQDKIMTTGGEGGMVTCNDESLYRRMWAFKDHGKNWEAVYKRVHPPGFRWLHESFGTNWRLTELQSTIGRIQLTRMPEWQATRAANAARLDAALYPFSGEGGAIRLPRFRCDGCSGCKTNAAGCRHAWYKYYVYIRPERLAEGWSRDRIITEIDNGGVPAMQGSCSEMYLEKAFEGTLYKPASSLPVARKLGENSLMFLVHPTITADTMDWATGIITSVIETASR